MVPYWVPWLGSALTFARNPDAFLRRASQKFGPIFRIKSAGQDLTYVVAPSLITAVYRNSKTFSFTPIRLGVAERVMQIPHDIAYSPVLAGHIFRGHTKLMAPQNIHTFVEKYTQLAHKCISDAIDRREDHKVQLVDLIIPAAYTSSACAFFGESFPAEKTYPHFTKFTGSFHLLIAGVTRTMMPGPWKAWDAIFDIIVDYIADLRKSGDPPPEMTDLWVSGGGEAGWRDRGIASLMASELFAIEANALYTIYWFITFCLRTPSNMDSIVHEIDSARDAWVASHPDVPLTATTFAQFMKDSTADFPLLTSGLQETLRLCTSTFSLREVVETTEFAGYQFNAGDLITCATRAVHMDEEIYENPTEFVLDRYVDTTKKFFKDGKVVQNYHMPFGGGVSICEGRHFAMAEMKTFIAILLTYATIEVAPHSSWPQLRMERIGTGIIPPRGDVHVRIGRKK